MEEIKILFFVLGTFFGNSESRIIADHATVTINPMSKTIEIHQIDLFTILVQREDSLQISSELKEIKGKIIAWRPELAVYPVKSYRLTPGEKGTLQAKILLHYKSHKDLEDYGFVLKDGYFSFRTFPDDYIQTDDGKLKDGFWHFSASKPFTFTQKPQHIAERFKPHTKGLLPIWEKIK